MKNIHVLSTIVVLLLAFPCLGQVSAAQQLAFVDTREDFIAYGPKSGAVSSKEMLSNVNETFQEFLTNGQIEEGVAFIQSKMSDCLALKNSNVCKAGLNFTSGYLLQKGATKQDVLKKDSYQRRAVTFYEAALEIYPDNKLVLNNLINLNRDLGDTQTTVKWLHRFAQLYPEDKVKYLVQIGEIYSNEGEFSSACSVYRQAYEEDQFSKQACGAMVQLYTSNNYPCTLTSTMRQFAYDCQEINLPNYSEKLLQKEFTVAMKDQNFNKAEESMILWAKVIVDNGWLDPMRVALLNTKLFPDEDSEISTAARKIELALTTLEKIFQAENIDELDTISSEYWEDSALGINVTKGWEEVTPLSVFSMILYMKGKKAYYKGDHSAAEEYWSSALGYSNYYDPTLYTKVASDLAQLYTTNIDLDPNGHIFNQLVERLFGMKGSAYMRGDKKMIRKLHITLGSIYYQNKVWGNLEGFGARNAKFQLEHALSEDLGPIVNPELREMLGDVYIKIMRFESPDRVVFFIHKAVAMYSLAIKDYLSFDQIDEADELNKKIFKTLNRKTPNLDQLKILSELGKIIHWRKKMNNSKNSLIKDLSTVNDYLVKSYNDQQKAEEVLSSEFIKIQFFKGLSDLGSNLPDDRKREKQIIYANALNRLKTVNILPSTRDFKRIKDIKFALEESVEQSRELEKMQMNKKVTFTYESGKETNSKVFSVPTFNKSILVPNQLFTLNDKLQNDYKKTNTTELIKYNLYKGNFELKQIDND